MTEANAATLNELDKRIATVRKNIRELIGRAIAYSGSISMAEILIPDRIGAQYALLAALVQERKAAAKGQEK